jgi:16S rRNA G527 N7-methylase RsmG
MVWDIKADFLKMYTQYLNGYTVALETFNRQMKNKKLQALLAERRANCPLDFMSYLIMPVQRIPRYELLLRELIRYTPESHNEAAKLAIAFEKVQGIGAHVNEQQRHVSIHCIILQ